MKKIFCKSFIFVLSLFAFATFSNSANAIPLNGEYSINVSTEKLGVDSWRFTYEVTNNNQQVGNTMTGLDGFDIELPENAIVSNVTVPEPYFAGVPWPDKPEWSYGIKDSHLWWWGYHVPSVYPKNTTATFSFEIINAAIGNTNAVMTTYWSLNDPPQDYPYWIGYTDAKYSGFTTSVVGPVAPVPEPATIFLLGCGFLGLATMKRKLSRRSPNRTARRITK